MTSNSGCLLRNSGWKLETRLARLDGPVEFVGLIVFLLVWLPYMDEFSAWLDLLGTL